MDHPSVAVMAVRLASDGEGAAVLLLRRKPEIGAGWQPVTGKVEAGETHEEAARRELAEETGLEAERLEELGLESEFVGYDGRSYRERAFVAVVGPGLVRVGAEHEEARFVPPAEARRLLQWEENRLALDLALSALGLSPDGF
ncbi:MAG: NUDIX domain-containing protein [Thermoplasmatota archaeon]